MHLKNSVENKAVTDLAKGEASGTERFLKPKCSNMEVEHIQLSYYYWSGTWLEGMP